MTIRDLAKNPFHVQIYTSTLSAKIFTSAVVGMAWIVSVLVLGILHRSWLTLLPLGLFIMLADTANTFNVVARSRERMLAPH
ncbi:MAG: hypothetical protein R2848_15340 [Thermomicrobiales bacterium]